MGEGPTFEEVLDSALQSAEREVTGMRWGVEPVTMPLLGAFAAPIFPPRRGVVARAPLAASENHVRPHRVPGAPPPFPTSTPPPPQSRRPPVRHLPLRHQLALDALVALGASLRADFTLAELRSAFRTLARRYHPDRHTAGDGDEQHRRARLFAAATDHYRCLLEVVRPRGR